MRQLHWVLSAVLCAACSLSPDATLGQRSSPIIGGVNDPGDPGVVLVIAQSNVAGMGASLCTGEVVSPHVVLTAAHCVSPVTVGSNVTFYVFTGWDLNDANQANNRSNFHSVRETHYDMQFDINNLSGGHDVGIVITNFALPGIKPLPLLRRPMTQNDVGTPIRLVGFGISNGADTMGTTAGTKRQVSTTIANVYTNLFDFGDATHNTCEGDSGGPAFMMENGVEVIAGITSYGDRGCMNGGTDTRIDVYASSFVDPYIQQFDGNGGGFDFTSAPVDFSQGGSFDMAHTSTGGDMAPAAGTVGATCHAHSECNSGVCALTGATGFCTQMCNPSDKTSCPTGTHCGLIDNMNYCVKFFGSSGGGGCDVGRADAVPAGAALLFAFLFATAIVVARRRRTVAATRR